MEDFKKNEKQNEIRIFENEQFGKVRIVMSENDEPLFCAKDDVTKRDAPTSSGNQQIAR